MRICIYVYTFTCVFDYVCAPVYICRERVYVCMYIHIRIFECVCIHKHRERVWGLGSVYSSLAKSANSTGAKSMRINGRQKLT